MNFMREMSNNHKATGNYSLSLLSYCNRSIYKETKFEITTKLPSVVIDAVAKMLLFHIAHNSKSS